MSPLGSDLLSEWLYARLLQVYTDHVSKLQDQAREIQTIILKVRTRRRRDDLSHGESVRSGAGALPPVMANAPIATAGDLCALAPNAAPAVPQNDAGHRAADVGYVPQPAVSAAFFAAVAAAIVIATFLPCRSIQP